MGYLVPPPPRHRPSDETDAAFRHLDEVVAQWDPMDELGFYRSDYASEDFDPLALLLSGQRSVRLGLTLSLALKPFSIVCTTNNTGPK